MSNVKYRTLKAVDAHRTQSVRKLCRVHRGNRRWRRDRTKHTVEYRKLLSEGHSKEKGPSSKKGPVERGDVVVE
jgi:hypothetical protein